MGLGDAGDGRERSVVGTNDLDRPIVLRDELQRPLEVVIRPVATLAVAGIGADGVRYDHARNAESGRPGRASCAGLTLCAGAPGAPVAPVAPCGPVAPFDRSVPACP